MKKGALQSAVIPGAVIAAGLAIVVLLTGLIERERSPLPEGLSDTDLHLHGARLNGFAFGMEGLAADWYFMRSLQYIGDKVLDQKEGAINLEDLSNLNPRLLYPLLDNATDLDPHFIAAYDYGTVILPAIDGEKAIALAAKGIANNPNQWRLYQQLGYVYWRLGRYDEAAETYRRGSAITGSSPAMKMMAAKIGSEGNSRSVFRSVYSEMLAGTTDASVRDMAERRLRELDFEDEREAVDRILAEFMARNRRCANSFSEIANALMATTLPGGGTFRVDSSNRLADPTGAPYLLDRQACRLALDPERTKLSVK